MKTKYFILVTILLTVSLFAQLKTTEQKNKILAIQNLENLIYSTKSDNLIGDVEKVESMEYLADLSSGKISKKNLLDKSSKTYNENGHLLHETRYSITNGTTSVITKVNYIYNDKEELTSIVVLEPNGDLKSKTILKYDDKGNIIERAGYDASGAFDYTGKKSYKYTDNENLVEITSYDPSGKLIGNRILLFNEKEYLMSDESNSEGYVGKILFKYDSLGNKVEEVYYSNGEYGEKIIYKYNEEGKLISEKHYNEDGRLSAMSSQSYYKYDKAGNEIEHANYSYDNQFNDKTRKEYTLDNKLNWIKCISFFQYLLDIEKPNRITERVITYYK